VIIPRNTTTGQNLDPKNHFVELENLELNPTSQTANKPSSLAETAGINDNPKTTITIWCKLLQNIRVKGIILTNIRC